MAVGVDVDDELEPDLVEAREAEVGHLDGVPLRVGEDDAGVRERGHGIGLGVAALGLGDHDGIPPAPSTARTIHRLGPMPTSRS